MTRFDLHPHTKPVPCWFAALLVLGAAVGVIVAVYYGMILFINFVGA